MLIDSMAKRKKFKYNQESDGLYFLKLVLYIVLGSQWLWLAPKNGAHIPIPLGLALGLLIASHDRFRIDRKIQFAVLLVAALVAFWGQVGIYVTV